MADPSFFQKLLREVNHPGQFAAMINCWMDDPINCTDCVATDVDRFLEQLMDEQREPRSAVDCDQLFDALKEWMKQASIEHRCAMMFNSEHMVGLSCISRNDDVELLKSVPLHNIFVSNAHYSEISLGFVSQLLTAAYEAENTLRYIFSSSEFAQIVGGGTTCVINTTPVRINSSALEAMLWRAFVPSHDTQSGKKIAQIIQNVILDNLNTVAVHGVLDVLSANHSSAAITTDFLTDPRFLNWDEKDVCLRQYLERTNTIFPEELIAHFPPPLFEVSACHCAYLILQAESFGEPAEGLFDNLRALLHPHEDGVWVVRRTIEKLNTLSHPPLTNFPDRDIQMLLECLSDSQIQQWHSHPWDKDAEFSISQYPQLMKQIILNHIPPNSAQRKRVL